MGMKISEENGNCRMQLDGDITIFNASEIRMVLLQVMAEHADIEVDLGAVADMDTAGLQLMLMAKRCPDKNVRFVNHSPAVLHVLELANLGQQLGDPLLMRAGA